MSEFQFGRYRIRRELGRGAMGVVYEAEDLDLGLDVALKIMSSRPGARPEAVRRRFERFCNEARALAGLRHPSIVRLFDQGEIDGRAYFTMELVRGTTLRDRIHLQGPLSLQELVRLGVDLCDALEHMHGVGVVHRDVKPENIMLLPDGGAMLMDFGIARIITEDGAAQSGGFEGSPAYMSPEQVSGRSVDYRTDIYSLAVTLYEAATGRRAFEGEHIPALTQRIQSEYPPPPAGVPLWLQGIMLRAMTKHPAGRYRRAAEMAADLRAMRAPEPAPAAPGAQDVPAGFVPSSYTPPAPVYLGEPESSFAPSPMPSPPSPGQQVTRAMELDEIWSQFLPQQGASAQLQAPGPAYAQPLSTASEAVAPASAVCPVHPMIRSAETCGQCGRPVCYTCLVEVVGRSVLCRSCAFP